MLRFPGRRWAAVAGLALLVGCAGRSSLPSRPSPGHLPPDSPLADRTLADADAWVRHYLAGRQPDSALAVLERSGGDRLLAGLQRAVILHHAGRWAASNAEFEAAEREMDRRYTHSLRRAAGSLLLNDRVLAWRPGGAEAAMIPVYRMLNYLALGDRDAAAVEARKAGAAGSTGAALPPRCGAGALSPYLAGWVYGAAGEQGDALVALRNAARAANACGGGDSEGPAPGIARDLLRWDGAAPDSAMGELVLVVEQGWVAHRRAEELWLPLERDDTAGLNPHDPDALNLVAERLSGRLFGTRSAARRPGYGEAGVEFLKLAWPAIRTAEPLPAAVLRVDGIASDPVAIEELSAGVASDLQRAQTAIAARAVARALAKHLLAERAEREGGRRAEWLGDLLGTLARSTGRATEQADTRSWTLLPARVWVVRVSLPAGEHRLSVELPGEAGVRRVDLGTVQTRTGEVRFASRRIWPGGGSLWEVATVR